MWAHAGQLKNTPLELLTKKAPIAVPNQPPITFNTPATLYTALSRPQARSAKDVPIATINVT